MKKIILLVIILTAIMVAFIPFGNCACALSTPHIVITEGIWLLDTENGSRLFLLPNSYYAKIDNMDNDFYYITFNGVSGKVEKSIVSTVGYHTQAPGTMQEIRIDPQYYDFKTIALKSSMDTSSEEILLPVNDSFIFLGEYPLSEMWYFIKYNDQTGYLKASRTTIPEMEIPAFIPETEGSDEPVDNPVTEPKDNLNLSFDNPGLLRILIIIGLSIPAMLLIFLLFKPQKAKRTKYYYSE